MQQYYLSMWHCYTDEMKNLTLPITVNPSSYNISVTPQPCFQTPSSLSGLSQVIHQTHQGFFTPYAYQDLAQEILILQLGVHQQISINLLTSRLQSTTNPQVHLQLQGCQFFIQGLFRLLLTSMTLNNADFMGASNLLGKIHQIAPKRLLGISPPKQLATRFIGKLLNNPTKKLHFWISFLEYFNIL